MNDQEDIIWKEVIMAFLREYYPGTGKMVKNQDRDQLW
jgi:hypothetical protein